MRTKGYFIPNFFTVEVVVELKEDFIMAFEDEKVLLCAVIATNVKCAVGFNFEVTIFLNLTEGIH